MPNTSLTPKQKLEKCKSDCLKYVDDPDVRSLIETGLDMAFLAGQMAGVDEATTSFKRLLDK